MKKIFLLLILLLITTTTIFGSEAYKVNTSLFYSKPGTVKSESRPVMRVGDTWNLDFLFSTTSDSDIKQKLSAVNNFFTGKENAIVIELITSISPNEFKIMSEVNLIPLDNGILESDNSYLYWFSYSPKKDNQKLEIQLNIKEEGNHYIEINFVHIKNAGREWFIKGTYAPDLYNKTTSDGYYYNMSTLNNSQTNYSFIFEK